jgi:two-component system sensor histidine kinase DevS
MEPGSQLSDEVLRRTLDAAPDGIVVVDPAGAILFVNPMTEQLFEYEHDELIGMSVDLLLPDGVRGLHAGRRAEYGEHPRTRSMGTGLDLRGLRRSGTEFPLEISLSPLRTGDGLLVVAVVRDITERRAADDELQQARQVLALVDDRERIARDLHDTVIQRLFAVGLSLQAALTRAANDDPSRDRIQLAIDEIDMTIRDIRSSIFALHTRRPLGVSLRDELLSITSEAARALGFEPSVAFDGPVDTLATDEIRENVLATVREALSNVARHAQASVVRLEVAADANGLHVCIRDDGIGVAGIGVQGAGTGSGVQNMSERAVALGGRCEFSASSNDGGTQIDWTVPLASDVA